MGCGWLLGHALAWVVRAAAGLRSIPTWLYSLPSSILVMLIAHMRASEGSQLGVASTTLESIGIKRKSGGDIIRQGRRTERGEEQPIIHADTGYGNAAADMYVGLCVFMSLKT